MIYDVFQSLHLFTRTGVDIDELGEKALKETKEQQVLKQRMQDIEQELGRLTSAVEHEVDTILASFLYVSFP